MIKPRIFDCFSYFNERELLEFRIKLLGNHVDGFIITEADHTHSGEPKPFTCRSVLEQLNLPLDRIRLLEINLPSYAQEPNNWVRERYQRDVAAQLFEEDAVYIVSDCDEIINPDLIPVFAQGALSQPNNIMRMNLAWLNCRADLRVCDPRGNSAPFDPAFVCLKQHVQQYTLSQIRDDTACGLNQLRYPSLFLQDSQKQNIDCGWHFSWFGGKDRIKLKMRSFLHSRDKQTSIFTNAVGDVNSQEMLEYLDAYKPAHGSHDPYGRTDYYLKNYPREQLPSLVFEMKHLHDYFFGNT